MFERYTLDHPGDEKNKKNAIKTNLEKQENMEIMHFPDLNEDLEKLNAEIMAVFPQVNNSESKKLREEFQSLRYKIFSEVEGFEPPNDAKLEIDSFDNYSAYVIIKRNNVVIAGCRLILANGEKQPMPVSVEWPELEFKPNSAEVSRFCLDTEIPTNERVQMIHFLHLGAAKMAEDLDIDHVYANIRKNFLLMLTKFIKKIGDKTIILNPQGKQYKDVGVLVPVEFKYKKDQDSETKEQKVAA